MPARENTITTQAELRLPRVTVQICRFDLPNAVDSVIGEPDTYQLNLCVTPRPGNSRAGFPEKWGPHRFEPLGETFLVPPGQRMHVRGDSGRQVSIVCRMARDCVEAWLDHDIDWTDRRLEASLDVTSPAIRGLLIRLAEEAHRPGLASGALAELLAGQLGLELCRYCASIEDGPVSGGLAAWRLRLIDERLRDASQCPTLACLAAICNVSVRQLTRGFRASKGCSLSTYVLASRIETAKRLLAGEHSVKAIAFATGFASPSSFAFAFHRVAGLTPSGFRQRLARANLLLPAARGSGGPAATVRPDAEGNGRCQPESGRPKQVPNKKRPMRRPAAGPKGDMPAP